MKRFLWTTPFLFTLAWLLYLYREVLHLVSPDQLIRLTVVLWSLLGLLIYPAYVLAHNREWASLLLTAYVFVFYFSEEFFFLVSSLLLVIFIFYLVFHAVRNRRFNVTDFSLLLNRIAILTIILSLGRNLPAFTQVPWFAYQRAITQLKSSSDTTASYSSTHPDIYFIVLDGYLRSDMLQELYGYDNTPFVTYLETKGFFVPSDIRSNYAKTAVSVPSILNMDYIHALAPGLHASKFWWLMKPFVNHNRVTNILKTYGYQTVALSAALGTTDNRMVDIYLRPYPVMLTDLEKYFLDHTPMRYLIPAIKDFASTPTHDSHRKVIIHAFEALDRVAELPGPKFVFVHILSPHPPFVFDRHGNHLDPAGSFTLDDASDFPGTEIQYKEGYIEQVEFVNAQMQVVVDSILQKSRIPPIIIIQSDHGSGLLTDFSSVENTCHKERFSPFGAYYLPGTTPHVIPSDLTAVNLFRFVLNQYFSTELPMLEDSQYFFEGVFLYRFVDVTSRVDQACVSN